MAINLADLDLAHTPAQAPPPGSIPNFVNPESQGYILIVVIAICFSLMFPIVALRVYSKNWVNRSFGMDDVACLLAVMGTVAYSCTILSSLQIVGHHQWDVAISSFTTKFLKDLILVFEMVYGPAIFFAKLSLFLLYLRLFHPSQWTKILIYFGIVSTLVFYTATTVTFGALCIPRSGETWMESDFSPRCGKSIVMTYVQGIFNVISDFYILLLPIPVVWNLQMPLRKKIGVLTIFTTGFFACIASVLGLYYRILLARRGDFTWREIQVGSLVVLEMSFGVICGCMPYLASFFKRQRPKSPGTSFKHLYSLITLKLFKRSKHSSTNTAFNRIDSHPPTDAYLETHILGSVKGGGKFLESGVHPQKEWLGHRSVTQQDLGESTIREEFQD